MAQWVSGPPAGYPELIVTVVLDGASLTLEDIVRVSEGAEPVELAATARVRMEEARAVVEEVLKSGQSVYGLTTGVAERKRFRIGQEDGRPFNRLLVRSHRVAQGPAARPALARATMVCLVNSYAKGVAGVRPALADMVLTALNDGFVPVMRTLGSLGQADLGPMADLAEGLLQHSGFSLEDNEGLALVNSNAFATASAAFAIIEAERLLDTADVAAALDLEAFAANLSSLHQIVVESRPYPGIRCTVANLRHLLEHSALWEPGSARNLQDPLTFRCIPQIHGATRDALAYARGAIETELNAAQGNPAVVQSERRVISVGNFDVVAVAAALDFVRIALAPVVTSAMERTVKLLQSPLSGLPAGLAAAPTTGDALAELAVASQALVVEARTLAAPVSYELASTTKGEGIEDRTTMAPLSARRLTEMVELGARVVAIELVVAAQAVDLRPPGRQGRGTRHAYELVRGLMPFTAPGEAPPDDLEPVVGAVRRGELAAVLGTGGKGTLGT
jgi:histidine ammonia-lyase